VNVKEIARKKAEETLAKNIVKEEKRERVKLTSELKQQLERVEQLVSKEKSKTKPKKRIVEESEEDVVPSDDNEESEVEEQVIVKKKPRAKPQAVAPQPATRRPPPQTVQPASRGQVLPTGWIIGC